ncbi:MAG: glutamate--tRNA ligase [Rhodospirillales bacterium]|nr:glutamate--tRNA ligase [Rhodospirillales bacterium]
MSVVTRIAPSPTGFMHIGTARTALFSWLYARGRGGKFLLRIEDTDRERYHPEAVDAIKSGMKWLGLNWDGDAVSQFERRDRHAEIARALVEKGAAYYCYCSPEELDVMRAQAVAEGRSQFYDRRWRDRPAGDAPPGVKPVIRIKAPLAGDSTVQDQVQGPVTVDSQNLDDFILLRSDGTPTYMLAVVVDDYDMGVTHVIRGNDHLNNTFRQKLIIEAMGWPVPVYAHIPLIHGPDGAKLSKRHGAQGIEDYRDMGYLPEALRNYLLRLGWGHGDDEIISMDQAVAWFDLDGIVKSPARFDFAKLESLNAHYMKEADDARLVDLVTPFLEKQTGTPLSAQSRAWLAAGMADLKQRAKTLVALADEAHFYVAPRPLPFEDKARQTVSDPAAQHILTILAARLETLEPWTEQAIEALCHDIANQQAGGKLGKVAMPLRAALTGRSASPPIFKAAEILGRREVLARLKDAIAN